MNTIAQFIQMVHLAIFNKAHFSRTFIHMTPGLLISAKSFRPHVCSFWFVEIAQSH